MQQPIALPIKKRWKPLCGDAKHWRVGIFSPIIASRKEVVEFEQHDCPELFMLIEGALTLVVIENGVERQIRLKKNVPVLVTAPHAGFCPNGSHTGKAFVVERDEFDTMYRSKEDWTSRQKKGAQRHA